MALVSGDQARRYGICPLRATPGCLEIAVADPLDLAPGDELGHLLNRTLETVVTTPTEIGAAISRYYGPYGEEADSALMVEETGDSAAGPTKETDEAPVGPSGACDYRGRAAVAGVGHPFGAPGEEISSPLPNRWPVVGSGESTETVAVGLDLPGKDHGRPVRSRRNGCPRMAGSS
ncbi:MAG: hypothetical protein J6386_21435 [Candidatus Synoicihabitans palmerolidicus]|nr:hypothetical protein [Candidatus Synoicihabitans palmerolidicus]